MCNKIGINIAEKLGAKSAVSTDSGKYICNLIIKVIEKGGLVELNFAGVGLLTSAFLNAAIGQLYNKYDSPTLQEKLSVVNMDSDDKYTLSLVIKRAKEYFANTEAFEKTVGEVL